MKYHVDGLPAAYKGRCTLQRPKRVQKNARVKSDRHGGYQPPSEFFGLQPRLKIRQVRRLQSLYRRLKALPLHLTGCPRDARMYADAFLEWKKIRTAKGYGHCWQNWILSFEAVPFLSMQLPNIETLEVVLQITKIDCDQACYEETRKRSEAFKNRMKIDQEHDFSRMTYKIVRSKEVLDLKEVPVDLTIPYSLYRCKDKTTKLRLEQEFYIPNHARVTLGDTLIVVTSQQDRSVTFKVQEGKVSPQGLMRIHYTALTSSEITDEFARFWKPFWQRDSPDEQFNDTTWQDFLQMLDTTNLPAIPQIALDLHDPKRLMKLIKKIPSGKAVGPCGWSNDELKCLPFCCVVDLAKIFEAVSRHGFGPGMMMAKTVLLSKIATPTSMNHVRPVTILSSLYRLYSKVIFQVTAHVWKEFFPIQISGGLPGRGVKEIAFAQKRKIEDFLAQGKPCGGLTMDLIKAFNTFGRYAVGCIMVRLGIPQIIVDSWIRSLSLMVRYPTLDGCVGHAITSTTGVPEGCSISVLAMLATSCFFYCRISCDKVQPYTYADNWSWLSTEQKAHFVAFREMQQVVKALRLQLDSKKSWHWALNKQFREACQTFHEENDIFENIPVKTQTKDLGEIVHYNKSCTLGFIKEKINDALSRLKRIEWIPATLQKKAMIIQSACWPLALYTADTTYIGQQHIHNLRKGALHALVGYWHTSSAYLACLMLSKHIMDPMLYILILCARTIRRFANVQPEEAKHMIQTAVDFDGCRAFGPASSFKLYLGVMGWNISAEGDITGPENISCNVLTDSTRFIPMTFHRLWSLHVVQISERKGIGNFYVDFNLGTKILAKFSDEDQQILKLNVVGGFQTEKRKANWSEENEGKCIFCGLADTREHRLLECAEFKNIREKHEDACNIIQNEREEWIYLPLPRLHDKTFLFEQLLGMIQEKPVPDLCDDDVNLRVLHRRRCHLSDFSTCESCVLVRCARCIKGRTTSKTGSGFLTTSEAMFSALQGSLRGAGEGTTNSSTGRIDSHFDSCQNCKSESTCYFRGVCHGCCLRLRCCCFDCQSCLFRQTPSFAKL